MKHCTPRRSVLVVVSLSLFLLAQLGLAQQTTTIRGRILDRDTKEPIAFCAVALSGTSLGSITNEKGIYVIENVPLQSFKIVASHIAYYNKVIDFNPDYQKEQYSMSLKAKVTELETVAVETRGRGKVSRLKRRNMETFRRLILGETYDRRYIEITNEDIVDFQDRMDKVLKTTKTYDLNIVNNHLGYEISYLNLGFSLSEEMKTFVGFPVFNALQPENDEQKQTWEANRERAYKGSLNHFFKSLITHTLDEEGFLAQYTNYDPSKRRPKGNLVTEQLRTKQSGRTRPNIQIAFDEEKGYYTVSFSKVIEAFFFREDGSAVEFKLKPVRPQIEVYPSGVLRNPLSIVVYGDLAQRGVYQMVPSNYQPKN